MALTDDLSDGFFVEVKAMCARLGCDPLDALKVWFSESIGVFADAKNPAGAYGINQITDLKNVGFTGEPKDYIALTAEEQLPYVEKYYKPYKGKLTSAARLYQVNFLPITIDKVTKPGDILAQRGGVFSNFYEGNKPLDPDKKGYITLDDLRRTLEAAITNTWKVKTGKGTMAERWKEIVTRLGAASATATTSAAVTGMLVGGAWEVTTQEGIWRYQFWGDGSVTWTDTEDPSARGTGSWTVEGQNVKLTWSLSEELWPMPVNPFNQRGEVQRKNGLKFSLSAKRPITK